MNPFLNNFFTAQRNALPTFAPMGSGGFANAEAQGNPLMDMIRQRMAQPQQQQQGNGIFTPEIIAKLLEDKPVTSTHVRDTAAHNPWANGFFKSMPEATAAGEAWRKDATPLPNWVTGRGGGTQIGAPAPVGSSFVPNSGDDGVAGGMAAGRSLASAFGSGSSTFPTPQPVTGQRPAVENPFMDQLFQQQVTDRLKGMTKAPGRGSFSFGAGAGPRR